MTTDEKREAIHDFCRKRGVTSGNCDCEHKWDESYFCHCMNSTTAKPERVDEWYAAIAKETGEKVDHPAHYQGKFECIDEMRALFGVEAVKAFCRCNIWKYKYRAGKKNGSEDLKKAEWYMEYLMKLEDM